MSIEKRDDTGFEVEARLEQLAEEIHAHHQAIERAWVETVAQAIELGEKLNEAKLLVGVHGQWIPWLRENFPGSVRTAQEYMRLARAKTQTAHLPTVRDAVAMLTQPKPKPEAAPAAELDAEPPSWEQLESARGVLHRAFASDAKHPKVPRWALKVGMDRLRPLYQLAQRAKTGDRAAREELADRLRRAGITVTDV